MHLPKQFLFRNLADFCRHDPFFFCKKTSTKGEIFFFSAPVLRLLKEASCANLGFGKQNQTGGLLVQSANHPDFMVFALLFEMSRQIIGKRV